MNSKRKAEMEKNILEGLSVWERNTFPERSVNHEGHGPAWFAAKYTLHFPFCWTPTTPFWFGGKRYEASYPCVAFNGKNFGFIIQRRADGLTFGRE